MTRVAVLIDGSNLLGALGRLDLGYPALRPLLTRVVGPDHLTFARFYGNPSPTEPWSRRWKAFVAANRHVERLDWFQGYRQKATRLEKAIDVAVAADLFDAHLSNRADKAVVLGGDGDHLYALKLASKYFPIRAFVVESQPTRMLARMRLRFTVLTRIELLALGIAQHGIGSPTVSAHAAPNGSPWLTPILTGAAGDPSPAPSIPSHAGMLE